MTLNVLLSQNELHFEILKVSESKVRVNDLYYIFVSVLYWKSALEGRKFGK